MIEFYYGEDSFQSSQKVRMAQIQFHKQHPQSNVLVFDCDDKCDITAITQSLDSQSLFSQKKMVIVKNFFSHTKAPEQKIIQEYLVKKNDDTIIFHEIGLPRKNASFFLWLHNNAIHTAEYKFLLGSDLEKWISKKVQDSGSEIDNHAIRSLVLCAGNDLWLLEKEIEKLICFANEKMIAVSHVEQIVQGNTVANMFETIEAIVKKDKARALLLLKKQIATGDSPFHIFSMYVYQLRSMLLVGGAVQDGLTDRHVIAQVLKIHPFVVQKTLTLVNQIAYQQIKKMYHAMTILDHDVKTGKQNIETGLDLFVSGI